MLNDARVLRGREMGHAPRGLSVVPCKMILTQSSKKVRSSLENSNLLTIGNILINISFLSIVKVAYALHIDYRYMQETLLQVQEIRITRSARGLNGTYLINRTAAFADY